MRRGAPVHPTTRLWRRVVIWSCVAVLLSPFLAIAAFYGVENISGQLAWKQAQRKLRTLGEPLTPADIRPPPLPDERNMAAAPIFLPIFASDPVTVAASDLAGLRLPGDRGSDLDIVTVARRFEAGFSGTSREASAIVTNGLAPMAAALASLREAANRPESVWPTTLDRGLNLSMPFLAPLSRAAEVIGVRALATLSGDSPAEALPDFLFLTDLAVRANEPSLLGTSQLQQAITLRAVDIVELGIDAAIWRDAELDAIGDRLATLQPLRRFAESIRGERVLFLTSADQLESRAAALFTFVDMSSVVAEARTRTLSYFLWALRPSGWNARDRARYLTLSQEYLDDVIRNDTVDPEAVADWNARISSIRRDDFELIRTPLTVLTLPAFGATARRAAFAQCRVDQARIACALERFRLKNGSLPLRLGELIPTFIDRLPRDVIGGRHFVYVRESDDAFDLYSLGWNGIDNAVTRADAASISETVNRPDWVWAAR